MHPVPVRAARTISLRAVDREVVVRRWQSAGSVRLLSGSALSVDLGHGGLP